MSSAFDYVKANGGLDTIDEYPSPYNGKIVSFYNAFVYNFYYKVLVLFFLQNNCKYVKSNSDVKVSDYINLPIDENTIKNAVESIGPVAVGK